jgi:hypothetical protein
MRFVVLLFVGLLVSNSADETLEVGTIDQKEAPTKRNLVAPKSAEGIETVGIRATIIGKTDNGEKRNVYVLVSPLSNPDSNVWWVQGEISRDGDKFQCSCQFGEENQGSGEYFAIVGLVTENKLSVGEMLQGLPEKMTYTKLKIIKRK